MNRFLKMHVACLLVGAATIAGSGNASIDDAEQCFVCRCAAERRAREVGAPAAVAVGAVTVGALRLEERPAARDLLRGRLWTCRGLERPGHL